MASTKHFGRATRRVDGVAKVTGAARYAADYTVPGLLHGWVVSSTIPAGRILAMHLDAARAVPGVVDILTHEHRHKTAWLDLKWKDQAVPPGHPFRPLHSERILFDGQPVALIVAETLEAARDAAALVRVDYERTEHRTSLAAARPHAYVPPKKRVGIAPPPEERGDFDEAYASSAVKAECSYRFSAEHHNPMELFATTCVYEDDGKLTIYDKTQGAQNSQAYVAGVFGLKSANVRVVNEFVGGAFGSALRPQHQLWLAVAASLTLKRSVRVTLTRAQMFHTGHRPAMEQTLLLGADADRELMAVGHSAIAETSRYEDYQEVVVNWSGLLYSCDNTQFDYKLAQVDMSTPCDMRAPGAASGVTALECAVDELAYAAKMDPLELRRSNYIDRDQNEDKELTSKELDACYLKAAEAFGWSERAREPRARREGHELVGYGVASGVWEASIMPTHAKARIDRDGVLTVSTAGTDIGTGTYTILAQIAADVFGLPLERVTVQLGCSSLPLSPIEGGSWLAASAGAATQDACENLREAVVHALSAIKDSPFRGCAVQDVAFIDGEVRLATDPSKRMTLSEVLAQANLEALEKDGKVLPNPATKKRFSSYAHSAVFAEVRVDEELGVVRVTRVVSAVAAGRIINPATARSQIMGGVVMGIGMALHEEALVDHKLGRLMNHNLADYHVPVNADVPSIEVIFVDEHDDKVSPLGVKGLGEIGIVGVASAIANAIFHATGKRMRDFPITPDKLLLA